MKKSLENENATKADLMILKSELTSRLKLLIESSINTLVVQIADTFHHFAQIMVTKDEFNEFKAGTEQHFYEVHAKLNDHDCRFDSVDRKLEKIDTTLNVHTRENTNFISTIEKLEKPLRFKKAQ